ncbi:MAG: SLC45 family MFS transporter [Thermofilum sp.]|jgi:MFS family permease|nr:SLC45 family MFS transporter [Thermofilum sp.]
MEKFSYWKIFLLGFGFFGISVLWSIYNSYVPVFLKELMLPSTLVGFIMTIDNIFAVVMLPYIGVLSDLTRTRIGRRKPYIIAGAPPAALTFALIPLFKAELTPMMLAIIVMNFSMALFRSPVIAFMPDITPSERRSQANGIINFMGGVGALLAFFVGSRLYEMNPAYPFLAGAALLAISSFLVVALVDEPEEFKVRSGERVNIREELSKAFRQSFGELRQTLSEAVRDRDKSLLFMLLSIFLWFVGYNAIETFFTSYAKWHLGIGEATGSFLLGFVALGFLVFSLPAGFIGARLGRRRTMTIGLVIIVALLALLIYLPAVLSVERLITAIQAAFLLLGFAWALVNVNSLPTVVDMTTRERLGTHTGLYYFASQTAAITGPPLAGLFIDLLGYSSLFPFSIVFLALSALTLQRVKRGEPRRGY